MARKFVLRVEFIENDDDAFSEVSAEAWLEEVLQISGELETIQNLSVTLESVNEGELVFLPRGQQ